MFFEAISSKIRMEILCLLREKPMSVTEICRALSEEQSKVSHNLKKMAECRVIEARKHGKLRIYSLNKQTIIPILDLVEKHVRQFCKGNCQKAGGGK